jgi:hypothetical protein
VHAGAGRRVEPLHDRLDRPRTQCADRADARRAGDRERRRDRRLRRARQPPLLTPHGLKLPLAAVHGYSVTAPLRHDEHHPTAARARR